MPTLRPIGLDDVPAVLGLNAANVELLAPMDRTRWEQLRGWADRADLVVHEGQVAGFVLTFAPATGYDSPNYRWFTQHYPGGFYYLDRIVLDRRFRRLGLGSTVYDELEQVASAHGRMVLEVNAEPPNEASLAFHRRRGYAVVGHLGAPGHVVALMAKELRGPQKSGRTHGIR